MAYQSQLINRMAQLGTVSYDLIISDTDKLLPTYRHSISLTIAQDTPARRLIVRNAAENFATNDQSQQSRRTRIVAMRDALIEQYQQLLVQHDILQALIDAGGPF